MFYCSTNDCQTRFASHVIVGTEVNSPNEIRRSVGLALFVDDTRGTSQVAHEDDASVLGENLLDGGQGRADSQIVGDGSVFEGNVKVDAHQDFLLGDRPDIVDRVLGFESSYHG